MAPTAKLRATLSPHTSTEQDLALDKHISLDAHGAVITTVSLNSPTPIVAKSVPTGHIPALVPGGINPQHQATILKAQKLLLRLTKALFAYGAPLFRVELRVQAAADSLGLPLSILSLPDAMVLAFGNGSLNIWPQTYIVKGFQGQNMGKLHEVDKWAAKVKVQCDMIKGALKLDAEVPTPSISGNSGIKPGNSIKGERSTSPNKNIVLDKFDIATDSDSESNQLGTDCDTNELNIEADQGLINNILLPKSGLLSSQSIISNYFIHPSTNEVPLHPFRHKTMIEGSTVSSPIKVKGASNLASPTRTLSPASPDLPGTPNAASPNNLNVITTKLLVNHDIKLPRSTVEQNTIHSDSHLTGESKSPLTLDDVELDWYLNELDQIVKSHSNDLLVPIRILASGLTAMLMLVMLNPATAWDCVLTFILGTMNGALSYWGEIKKVNALEVLVPMAVSMAGKLLEVGLKDQICFGTITMFACFSYFPGSLMALSMVELSSRNLVSGTVRMFYSFVRSVKFGFGLAMGARLIGWLNSHGIPGVDMPKDNIHCMNSTTRPYTADVYSYLGLQLLVFIPMSLSINIILRGKRSQWLGMCVASAVGLITLQMASQVFTKDASAALGAFAIGIVSHIQARFKDDLAIANILAGITWMTPGSVGVRGATLLMTDDLKGSTSFALDMIIRTMSVSIGLYVSGLVLFPMVRKSKLSVLSL